MSLKKIALGILLVVIVAGFFAALMSVSAQIVASARPTNFDYYSFWIGSRAVLNGQSPYGEEIALSIQRAYFGDVLPPGEYQHNFPNPPYVAYLFFPLALLPFGKSLMIWLALQIPIFIATVLLAGYILDLRIKPLQYVLLTLVGSFFFMYPMISYARGQISILLLFLFTLSAFFLMRGNVAIGGALLAVTSIRPDYFLAAIVIAIFLLRRSTMIRNFIVSVTISLAVLTLSSMAFVGFWIPEWFFVVTNYSAGNPFTHWPPEFINNDIIRSLVILCVLVWGGWYVWKAFIHSRKEFDILAVSALILVFFTLNKQTGPYNLTLLLIPAFLLFAYMKDNPWRWSILILFVSPWIYRFQLPIENILTEELVIPLEIMVFQQLFVAIRHSDRVLTKSPD